MHGPEVAPAPSTWRHPLIVHVWQDRPGQFYVLLDTNAKPFTDPAQKQLAGKLRKCVQDTGGGGGRRQSVKAGRQSVKAGVPDGPPDHAARVELLLDAADEGIGDALKQFEKEQAIGERLNEVTEKYFEAHPRPFDAPWPSQARARRARVPHLVRARRSPQVHVTDFADGAGGGRPCAAQVPR